MRRFSILSLMGFVLALAVAFAALRGANQYWAGGLVLAVLGLLGYATLASVHRQGKARAAWLGFLVLGGGYFLAVKVLPAQESGWLPTSQLLSYVERQVIGANAITVNFTPAGTVTTTATSVIQMGSTPVTPASPGTPGGNFVIYSSPNNTAGNLRLWNAQNPSGTPWAPFLPGAANGDAFRSVGHSLFALLAGWIGVIVSKRMLRDRSPETGDSLLPTESPNAL
jgi:hypothetical protein